MLTTTLSTEQGIASQRLAVFDLGSNTARLIVMGYFYDQHGQPYSYQLLDELRFSVRLAEGLVTNRNLHPRAFQRGIDAVESAMAYCRSAGISTIIARATSAVRDASNGPEFLAEAARHGMGLEPMSGLDEARTGVLAVVNSLPLVDGWVLDIGGGSAQLSQVVARRFVQGVSVPFGALRSKETFLHHDPPKESEIRALRRALRKALMDSPLAEALQAKAHPVLVGMGGSIRNLARMYRKAQAYPLDLHHGYCLSYQALHTVIAQVLSLNSQQRSGISGLNEERADIIPAAAIALDEIMQLVQAESLQISGYGVREGMFFDSFLQDLPDATLPDVRGFTVRNLERNYYPNSKHNMHVQKLAWQLFDQLHSVHGYGEEARAWLGHAALLHDIGMAISYYDHHKHGLYLLSNHALPGFSHREQALLALLVRYHRKGSPNDKGLESLLQPGDSQMIAKLASLLRLAEYLDRSKAQLVEALRCTITAEGIGLELLARAGENPQVELRETEKHKVLFEQAFEVPLQLSLRME